MSDIALKVENISKQYRLGSIGSGTLQADLQRWWAKTRGKEDPFLKIGDNNQLDQMNGDYVWALKDINFEVKKGEILGIIGKNGAGKSTLLKILSKVTAPTTGKIFVNGRIASLLEVGTGFHPELTGRENIFLNGAILGMKKHEIKSKLDEIVAFSGVEKYLDTPVKRYSSGMYVRLAFAVAAHLEPDILIVDEVLAVGDAEFQKKAIGKMQDVSRNQGRTVLFVSHNMNAIKRLCPNCLILDGGKKKIMSSSEECINLYLNNNISSSKTHTIENLNSFQKVSLTIDYPSDRDFFYFGECLKFSLELVPKSAFTGFVASIGIRSTTGSFIRTVWTEKIELIKKVNIEFYEDLQLGSGHYYLTLGLSSRKQVLFYQEDILSFIIEHTSSIDSNQILNNSLSGQILNPMRTEIKF